MSTPSGSTAYAVELDGITKTYPGVRANDDVRLRVVPGTVHAVVGENGAGKSTLMKIMYGAARPDRGTLRIGGEPVSFSSPADAIAAGIGMVFQHFKLAENLSVLDNVILGQEPVRRSRFGRIDRDAAARRIVEISERYGLAVDPYAMVRDLGVGRRQRVELIKVLFRGARILILDEPTALLTVQESADLLSRIRGLCEDGLTVVFISHHLDEVVEISDAITVMRRGKVVADVLRGETDVHELAVLMVGAEPAALPLRDRGRERAVLLRMAGVTATAQGGGRLDLDLEVGAGEIVGVAGVEGNGQDELVDALLGVLPLTAGTVVLDGRDLADESTAQRRVGGLGCIPQDRQREGVLLDQPLWRSQLLGHLHDRRLARGPWLRIGAVRRAAEAVVASSDVRVPSVDLPASALSGGNQQKFIVGRELDARPDLLVAAQPTRGVDVGAQRAIWARLIEAAERGTGVLLISADLEELLTLSDRIVVMVRGRVVAVHDAESATVAQIGRSMTQAVA
ncbi:ABC transporter ATP-binding protein [Nocardioides sp. cx-173]|uniref:ABC transporter ATP-binding protein n=1 Tax=Nocardioides sp. cx-173 TaxID=2898796 RepID=UPI001E53F80B|nr:ABC transporter ATP-binding protein [Nocardioides sp. cx-173]MCD4524045.1 ABC transporter ATP-binding protein [Nocardioides sp. cx-173]UGB41446.1 ABC transporter ATP-binding protein [Nocardioides sp. cx-173]